MFSILTNEEYLKGVKMVNHALQQEIEEAIKNNKNLVIPSCFFMRGSGKTATMIKMASKYQIPLLFNSKTHKNQIELLAKELNLKIPKMLSLKEIKTYNGILLIDEPFDEIFANKNITFVGVAK